MEKKQVVFWLFTISFFLYLILPGLFMDGMFADGVQYSCVSMHLSDGKGSFWFPYITEAWNKKGANFFLEQPPLMYALQAPFFSLLGKGIYTERVYILMTLLITSSLIIITWRYIVTDQFRKYSWLPLLFWISIPLVSWTYRQNMQENTMAMFTTAAIYFGLRSIYSKNLNAVFAGLTGIFIFLASFTKGLPGLFPLVIAFMAYIAVRTISFRKMLYLSLIYLLVPVLIYTLLFFSSENAAQSLEFYARSRLFQRVTSSPVVDSHFYILGRLIFELLPAIAMLLIMMISSRQDAINSNTRKDHEKKARLFFLLGLCGSLPLMMTLVQRGFYMSISFPAFAIAFALIAVPFMDVLAARLKGKILHYLTVFFIVVVMGGITLTFLLAGKPGRSKELLHDVYAMDELFEPGQLISCDTDTYQNWPFQFYMLRVHEVHLDYSTKNHTYYITERGKKPKGQQQYIKIEIGTEKFDLFQKINSSTDL